jgi:hypothetical protein
MLLWMALQRDRATVPDLPLLLAEAAAAVWTACAASWHVLFVVNEYRAARGLMFGLDVHGLLLSCCCSVLLPAWLVAGGKRCTWVLRTPILNKITSGMNEVKWRRDGCIGTLLSSVDTLSSQTPDRKQVQFYIQRATQLFEGSNAFEPVSLSAMLVSADGQPNFQS